MFFVASKVLAVLLQPLNHPYILLLAALVMRLMRKRRARRFRINRITNAASNRM